MALTQRDAPAEMGMMGPRARAPMKQKLAAGSGAHAHQPGRFDQGEGGHAGAWAGDNQPSANWGGGGQPGPAYLQVAGSTVMAT